MDDGEPGGQLVRLHGPASETDVAASSSAPNASGTKVPSVHDAQPCKRLPVITQAGS
jgi:hypothetical protein